MSIKSNTAKAIEAIKAYLIENTEPEITEAIEWTAEHPQNGNISDTARTLYEAGKVWEAVALFIMEEWKERRNPNHPRNFQENFVDWLNGLPLNFCDYIVRQPDSKTLLAGWLEQTEAEQARFSDTEADAHTGRLIYREVSKTATKHGFNYPL